MRSVSVLVSGLPNRLGPSESVWVSSDANGYGGPIPMMKACVSR